ncbi:MAG: hypothetical protein KF701_09350 [Anaerolineales bacterium]|nr:MAG: hypothetical protein KF701_09350 [Anaerolineales bacterium]
MAELEEWLYILRPNRPEMLVDPTYAEQIHVREHYAYQKHLLANNILVDTGRTRNDDKDMLLLVIVKTVSGQAAQDHMLADPLVKNGLMSATLYPYWAALQESAERTISDDTGATVS